MVIYPRLQTFKGEYSQFPNIVCFLEAPGKWRPCCPEQQLSEACLLTLTLYTSLFHFCFFSLVSCISSEMNYQDPKPCLESVLRKAKFMAILLKRERERKFFKLFCLQKYISFTHMYTLLYLQWITNKDLLYSTWNSAQCYVAAWMGSKFGAE